MKTGVLALAAIVASIPAAASAQTLMGAPLANNGSGGVFMEFTPTSQSLQIESFRTYFSSAAGTAVNVEVWTRPGTYVGFTTASTGWTLTQTASGTSAGSAALGSLPLTTPVLLPVGGTTAVYIHAITTGGGIRYNGTSAAPPTTMWANADVSMFSAHARTTVTPFGTTNTPRTFAGEVNYSVVPAPGVLGALGLAGLLAARRRRA